MSNNKIENRQTVHHNVRMSDAAYNHVKDLSTQKKYRGRGVVGVLDDLILGEFTTIGSGRVDNARSGEREQRKKS